MRPCTRASKMRLASSFRCRSSCLWSISSHFNTHLHVLRANDRAHRAISPAHTKAHLCGPIDSIIVWHSVGLPLAGDGLAHLEHEYRTQFARVDLAWFGEIWASHPCRTPFNLILATANFFNNKKRSFRKSNNTKSCVCVLLVIARVCCDSRGCSCFSGTPRPILIPSVPILISSQLFRPSVHGAGSHRLSSGRPSCLS